MILANLFVSAQPYSRTVELFQHTGARRLRQRLSVRPGQSPTVAMWLAPAILQQVGNVCLTDACERIERRKFMTDGTSQNSPGPAGACVLAISGFGGSGKTTLIEQILGVLKDEQWKVAVVKHHHKTLRLRFLAESQIHWH